MLSKWDNVNELLNYYYILTLTQKALRYKVHKTIIMEFYSIRIYLNNYSEYSNLLEI